MFRLGDDVTTLAGYDHKVRRLTKGDRHNSFTLINRPGSKGNCGEVAEVLEKRVTYCRLQSINTGSASKPGKIFCLLRD